MSVQLLKGARDEADSHWAPYACDSRDVLRLIGDEDTQTMLECTVSPKTVSELAECTGLSLSTAYRKIDQLTEAGLLDRSIRLTSHGHHPTEYRRAVEEIDIYVDGSNRLAVDCYR